MKKTLLLAAAVLGTAITAGANAQSGESVDPKSDSQQAAQPPNNSTKQGIKNDAASAKQGIKRSAREVKQGIKNGAAKIKRDLAVAQCNDGRYSYTHHLTCNHHGGVRRRFR
jgi:hypothetical protein